MLWLRHKVGLKNRRGAFAVMFALLSVVMMGVAGIAVDMSRVATMKTELQTVADAAALAGAIQFQSGYTKTQWETQSRRYVDQNIAMSTGAGAGDVARIDVIRFGKWNAPTRAFTTAGVTLATADAVEIAVSRPVTYMFARIFGFQQVRVNARAVGWAGAPVNNANCLKPWALPYTLMISKINTKRGLPNTAENLTRPWDNTADVDALKSMTEAERKFSLKLGSGNAGIVDPVAGTTMPGNFYGVQLPKWYDSKTNTYDNANYGGGNEYRNNIESGCHALAVGDSLKTQTGNLVGPTVQGVQGTPGICETITSNYDCVGLDGQVGVKMRTPFYLCATGCNGQSKVGVQLLGSFTLTKVYTSPNVVDENGVTRDNAEIVGIFNVTESTGSVGPGASTLQTLILAR